MSPGWSPAPSLTPTPAERAQATLRLERSVVGGNLGTMLGSMAAVGVLCLTVLIWAPGINPAYARCMDAWALLLLATLAHGVWISYRKRARPWPDADFIALSRHFMAGSAACGIAWGLAAWLLLPGGPPGAETLILVSIAMVVIGAGGALAGFRRCLVLHVGLLVAVFDAGLLARGGSDGGGLALAFLILGGLSVANGLRVEAAMRTALYSGFRLEAEKQDSLHARQEAESARRAAERADAAKTAFLAAAGHDLRQPLHALYQYMAQIRRANRDAALTPVIGAADQAFDALSDLLDAVLEVSKLMLGRVRPEWQNFALAPLFTRLEAQLRPFAEQKNLRMRVDCPAEAYVRSDALLLERVLRNLCLNAIKFTRSGEVRLRARLLAGGLVLTVADTGIGIAAADLPHVFEPFVQLGNAARRREQGLGLGLAIVRDLCSLLELPLRVRSRPGRGSVFRLRCAMPDARTLQRLQARASTAPDRVPGTLVALIDDDPLSLEATAFTLADMGCQVLPALSSEAALQALAERDDLPHAIVSDLRLDGETGLEAIARLRATLAERYGDELEVAALVISGDTHPDEVQRVAAAGFRLLRKPVRPEALHAELNQLFERLLQPAGRSETPLG